MFPSHLVLLLHTLALYSFNTTTLHKQKLTADGSVAFISRYVIISTAHPYTTRVPVFGAAVCRLFTEKTTAQGTIQLVMSYIYIYRESVCV